MKKKLSLFLVMILMFSAWSFAVAEETDALPAQWVNASVVGNVSEETSTDPADDYYLYVNKQWLLDTTLTDTKYYITWFSQGQDLVTEQVAGLLSGELSQDHDASQTQLFYQQYLDMDTRNALGEAPLLPYLEKIESISTMEDLDAYVLDDDALSTLIGWTITTDMMDASRYIAYLGGASLSLDDADEYQELTDLGARKKAALTKMLEEMLQLCGYTQELMSVDELATMSGNKCILQLRGVRPFLSDKYDITRHPNYPYTADADPKNAFNIEAFLSTRLTVKPGDTFVTFETDEREEEEPS